MNIILLQQHKNLGNLGDQVNVKNGFARNFLIPQGKAVRASKDNIAHFQLRRAELEKLQAENLAIAQSRAEKLSQLTIILKANAGEDGKLFGSIGTRDIAIAINAMGEKIEKNEVFLPNGTLRQLGEYEIQLQLQGGVKAAIKLSIVATNV